MSKHQIVFQHQVYISLITMVEQNDNLKYNVLYLITEEEILLIYASS